LKITGHNQEDVQLSLVGVENKMARLKKTKKHKCPCACSTRVECKWYILLIICSIEP